MGDNNYNEDKKLIMETLKNTSQFVQKLNDKFEDFKLETSKSIVVIQTKLAMYLAGAIAIVEVARKLLGL